MTFATLMFGDSPLSLVETLDDDLSAEPLSPFVNECIVVQSLGLERWLRQQLAQRQGCAASVQFPFPAAFCHALARTLNVGGEPLDTRFGERPLTWALFELLSDSTHTSRPECAALRTYLDDADAAKRFALARRIATRFDDYQLYRPDVLLAWEAAPVMPSAAAHLQWQAYLWRTLTANRAPRHLARWFTTTIEQLERSTSAPVGLPARVSVFGVSTLPPLFIRLLHAIARFVPVRFYVFVPHVASFGTGANTNSNTNSNSNEPEQHPATRAFGSASRTLVSLLTHTTPAPTIRTVNSAASSRDTVLGHLQRDIRRGATTSPVPMPENDASLRVHVCHSPTREMEVLRDQLLDAFVADPTLRPHDVLVLVPDVSVYGPLADAVFRATDDGPGIPHRVADRALARDASSARAMLQLLELVTARGTASEVINLLHIDVVRRAAGITSADIERIVEWMREAGIRWGLDGATRSAAFDLPNVDDNSWRRGLDRLMMGYATGRLDALVGGVLPVAGDTLGDMELLGRFVNWVDALFETLATLRRTRTLADWSTTLSEIVERLVEADGADEEAMLARVRDAIHELDDAAPNMPATREVPFEVVSGYLSALLDSDEHGTGFLSGRMTVCAIKPMRSIPFRVIAMLGLDDASFPRRERRAAFDLLEIEPRDGDRDTRSDDRQLFLDTLLCAQERLILSYVGRSQKTNAALAPSVVIDELLDIVDASFTTGRLDANGKAVPARTQVVVEHRLQPFSASYFDGQDARLFSFSDAIVQSVRAARAKRSPAPFVGEVSVAAANESEPPLEITIAELIDCWSNPARFYCQRTLALRIPRPGDGLDDVEPMEVDNLQRTVTQQRLLDAHLSGDATAAQVQLRTLESDTLPSAALATAWFKALSDGASSLLHRVGTPAFLAPLHVDLSGRGWRLTGRIDGLVAGGRLQVRAAKIKDKDRARAWVTHVVLSAVKASDVEHLVTTLIGTDATITIGAVERPMAVLDVLMRGVRRTLETPMPFFEHASYKYASSSKPSDAAIDDASQAYIGSDYMEGDASDEYVALCWRARSPFDDDTIDEFVELSSEFWSGYLKATGKASAEDTE